MWSVAVPRTATVRAATPLRLQTLASDSFLPVVTDFIPSAREAGISVDAMLDRYRRRDRPEPPASTGGFPTSPEA
jgi:hypothetical protein